ncbi:MAG: hypothetical protein ABEH88_09420 [Halobacteriales archaeon]
MGLRCTVMGHDYGESQRTERREERGDEMVVTVREYRECRRCSHQKTMSENTEVRSGGTDDAADAEGIGETADTTGRPAGSRGQGDPTGTAPDSTTDAAVDHGVTPNEEAGGGSFDTGTVDTTPEKTADGDDEAAVAEDDGIILEDNTDDGSPEDESDGGRGPGEWPDSAKENPETARGEGNDSGTGGDWPTPDVEDQGYDAKPTSADSDDDVEFVSDLADESGASTTGESTSEETTTGGDSSPQSGATSGIERADSDPAARQPPPSSTAVLSCPQCGHTRPSRASSLRPGDICPECGDGYLAEREE